MNDPVLQTIVNILQPVVLAWAAWLTNRVISLAGDIEKKTAENVSVGKELERMNAEIIAQRNGYGELASALARLSAQTEMVLVLLEQLKREIKK